MAVWALVLKLDTTIENRRDVTVCFSYFEDERVGGTRIDGEMGAV